MWAGQHNIQWGDTVVGVGYEDDRAVAALQAAFVDVPASARSDVPVAFGVRSVRVGLRRREVWLVHHGTPVRHRVEGLDEAVRAVRALVESSELEAGRGQAKLSMRVYVKNGRAVLLDVPDTVDVDERPLAKSGIEVVPTLAVVVEPDRDNVVLGDRQFTLHGVALGHAGEPRDLVARRIALVDKVPSHRVGWAWTIDRLADRLIDAPPGDEIGSILRLFA